MTDTTMIKTKIGQTRLPAKDDAAAAMLRLVVELRREIEEALGHDLGSENATAIDNVYYTFAATQTKRVQEEVRHG